MAKKDKNRDYCTDAFRFFMQVGGNTELFKAKIREEYLKSYEGGGSGVSKPTEAALIRAEQAVDSRVAEVKDVEAVEKVIAQLKAGGRSDIVKCIEIVYFTDADKELMKSDIQSRVDKCVIEIHISERQVYKLLGQARKLFAIERGLRV